MVATLENIQLDVMLILSGISAATAFFMTLTKNEGIEITNITTIFDPSKNVYISLTGDQCALTNIRITKS